MASTDAGSDPVAVAILSEVSSDQYGAGMERDIFQDDILGSTLPQQPIVNKESQIFIRACNRTVALNVNLQCDTVEDMKRAIEEREGIPVEDQHLAVCGKPLRQGAFLRDYNTLRQYSTVDISMRVRGGALTEMTIVDFVAYVRLKKLSMIENITIPTKPGKQQSMKVMSRLGRRILHGVLSCVLNAHGAGLAYDDASHMDDFRVYVYDHEGRKEFERVVYARDAMLRPLLDEQFIKRQDEIYQTLRNVIGMLFPEMPLHVENLVILLNKLLARCIRAPKRRTQLLQAYAAMISSSVGVATMLFNLKRFYDQLDRSKLFTFEQAMKTAAAQTTPLLDAVKEQPLFVTVYRDDKNKRSSAKTSTAKKKQANTSTTGTANDDLVPNITYTGDTGMFNFARNWFTHVPEERWPSVIGSQIAEAQFTGLPQLEHIFTHHFSSFMTEALLQLYMNFDGHDLLTEIIVPLA